MASKTTQRIVIVLASTLLLAGCTSAADIPESTAGGSSAGGSATGDSGASAPATEAAVDAGPRPVPTATLAPVPVAATGECTITTVGAVGAGGLGGVDLEVVRDRGSREGATGTVRTATDGAPEAYVVASGDNPARIADRFCVSADYLDALNSVRRDGVTLDSLYGGDTLNLDPATVLTVGDQNGRVLDNDEPEPLPVQEG
ncbi:hypothetical protein [Rathayibacter sp. VKM Ac-2760]|uniref:hypothetical protein n=1 Tax=Rathayibacter sp. VKM Ac-2760 TaxID=2609253 RepID=UPI0013183F92|nr:hypothetical protein [Rathayibacter sp. VKM Ac-2760]QHC57299.1 hypothetical protein GSU72_00885 [Rathayibacter sp. VKM Ac-2760]